MCGGRRARALLSSSCRRLPCPPTSPTFPVGDKALDGYSKKKYVCKLLFIFLLGHDIDFGHMEAVNLLSSNRYTEKQIVSVAGGGRGAGWGWHPGHLRRPQGPPPRQEAVSPVEGPFLLGGVF